MKAKDRKPGFYWVEIVREIHTVARWDGHYWYQTGSVSNLTDAYYECIGPRVPDWVPRKRKPLRKGQK